MIGKYLLVEDVASLLGVSKRTVHEYSRTARIPHRVLPHGRRVLFEEEWLRAWADGAELERIDLHGGGRIVRPIESEPARLRGVA
jgi:excisionase family DNA binding protein